MTEAEGGDLERVFAICDTDGDGLLNKEDLEGLLKDIGVESEDINEFMWGLQAEEFITFPQFVLAIEKFRTNGNAASSLSLGNSLHSYHGSRSSPRSIAGSNAGAGGADHSECNYAIHELNTKNSVLSKQLYSLEVQVHELSLFNDDQQKNEKLQAKELKKLQGRFSSVSAELEVAKQVNKDMINRENELKKALKQLQDQRGNIEDDLQVVRAELDAVRSEDTSSTNARVSSASIPPEAQAELYRLADALERSEIEAQQLRRVNEDLQRLHSEDEYHIKVLDARIERLNLEIETKDNLFAELGLVPDKSDEHTHDKLGNTWHGFRTVSPLFSELGQVQDEPLHPSLIDDRNLLVVGKNSLDSAFIKEKVANLNEDIRRRTAIAHRRTSGDATSHSEIEMGDSDMTNSVSESDNLKETEKSSDDQNDLVTNQLMNLSDLVITTSDISHNSQCISPTYLRDSSSTSRADSSSTPVPVSDATIEGATEAEDEESESEHKSTEKVSEEDSQKEAEETEASPLDRGTTLTPSHVFGNSPDEAHTRSKLIKPEGEERQKVADRRQINGNPESPRGEDANKSNDIESNLNLASPHSSISPRSIESHSTPYSYRTPKTTPRRHEETNPTTPRSYLFSNSQSQSAPSTYRGREQNNYETPNKPIPHSKSDIIRTISDVKHYTPMPPKPKRPVLVRHKSEAALSPGLGSLTGRTVERVTPDQVNELQEFALKAGLIRPRSYDYIQRVDKYSQVDPAELDASRSGTDVNSKSALQRSKSQPSVAAQRKAQPTSSPSHTPRSAKSSGHTYTTPRSTPHTPHTPATSRSTPHTSHHAPPHQVDRKVMIRGNTYLVRLLSHPDPAIDELEDTVKKLEAELVAIEERFNKASASSSSNIPTSPSSAPTSSRTAPSSPVPTSPPPLPGTPTSSPSAPFLNASARRTPLRPSPLVNTSIRKKATPHNNIWNNNKYAIIAGVGGCFLIIALLAFLLPSTTAEL